MAENQSNLAEQEDLQLELATPLETDDIQDWTKLDNNQEVSQENSSDDQKKLQEVNSHALVFIMSGIHKGAGCAVYEETKIGSSIDADLIITDPDIVDTHLILTPIQNGLDFSMQVTCKGDSLVIDGINLLTTEQSVVMQESFVLTIGMVNINVTLYKASKTTVVYKKYIVPYIQNFSDFKETTAKYIGPSVILSDIRNIILFVLFLLLVVVGIVYLFFTLNQNEAVVSKDDQYKNIGHLSTKEKSISGSFTIQAKEDLAYVLKKYDLHQRISLSVRSQAIYAEGKINGFEFKNWGKVLNWFDTTYGAHVSLIPLIEVNNGQRRTISFKAVVTQGSMPYVVSWTGDKFRPGATLPGGWIILDIQDRGVLVRDAVDNREFIVQHIRSSSGSPIPDFN